MGLAGSSSVHERFIRSRTKLTKGQLAIISTIMRQEKWIFFFLFYFLKKECFFYTYKRAVFSRKSHLWWKCPLHVVFSLGKLLNWWTSTWTRSWTVHERVFSSWRSQKDGLKKKLKLFRNVHFWLSWTKKFGAVINHWDSRRSKKPHPSSLISWTG
jgi:hypothetical protein